MDTLLYTEYVFIDFNLTLPINYFAGLWGQEGNDTLEPGLGIDDVDGGNGTDLLKVDYSTVTTSGISTTIGNNGSGSIFAGGNIIAYTSIEKFDITGTSQADNLIGGNLSDTLQGGAGNDILNAGGQSSGYSNSSYSSGSYSSFGQADILIGGLGRDRFILGDEYSVFYDDNNPLTAGTDSYAQLNDFNPIEDFIQLQGINTDYRLVISGTNTQLFKDKPSTEPDELIAIVNGQTALALTSSYFNYVSTVTLPTITLALPTASVSEDGTPNLVYTFTRTGSITNSLVVNYGVTGTATLNTDYSQSGATSFTATTGSITFAPGSNTATLTLNPTADNIIEANETISLTLTNGTGYTVGTSSPVIGTITNDDTNSILSITDLTTVIEGKDTNALVTISISNPGLQNIFVNYTSTPLDAIANTDYTSQTGTLTIAPGSSTATLSIPILNDNLNETDESFLVTLSNPINATINPDANIGEVTITDTWQTSITRTLPINVENLKLNGVAAINGTGNAGNNIITGNSANNILTGATGKDTLTGGLGRDRFDYKTLTDSLLANFDVITDFNANASNDLLLVTTARSSFTNVGTVATLDNAGIIAKLNTTNFGINAAAQFIFGTRSFVAINDGTAGFSQTTDAIIEITGLTGTLGLTNFVTV